MNVAETLLTSLKHAKARAIFGLPGDYILPFFSEAERTGILPLYTLSHEPSVGFAADGAARQGGGLGVAAVTYGAGAMNMVNPVACAWAEHSPLVVISGAPGTDEGKAGLMLHHQIKTAKTQMNVFTEFTCDQARIDDPKTAPEIMARVLQNALTHSRPVYIELPRNMSLQNCAGFNASLFSPPVEPDPGLLASCIDDIAGRLQTAENPAILAGARVRRFDLENSVFDLADHWQVPLLNTFMGKGLFAGKKRPYAGSYLGLAGTDEARQTVEDADLVLMLGVIACDTNFGVSGKRLDDASIILSTEQKTIVCGREYPGVTLATLVPALKKVTCSKKQHPVTGHAPVVRALPDPKAALRPDDIAPVLDAALRQKQEQHPLVCDIGDCLFMAMEMEGREVLASGYYATMGFGVPAGLGLSATTGQRPVILTGDGGFQMTGWELINAPRYGWDPVVIVLNNASWEMLRSFGPEARYNDIAGLSYARIAESLGGRGQTARTPGELSRALETALSRKGTFEVIDAVLPKNECTAMMKRFAAALKQNMAGKAA